MNIVRLWGPVIFLMGVIFVFSSHTRISVSQEDIVNFLFFKTGHILEYATLYILIFRAMKNSYQKQVPMFWTIWSFFIVILYACSDEIHQLFVPTRGGGVRDVIIDTAGAVLAWISITKLLPKSPKKLQKWVRYWLAM
jgi:VanZ family protein